MLGGNIRVYFYLTMLVTVEVQTSPELWSDLLRVLREGSNMPCWCIYTTQKHAVC